MACATGGIQSSPWASWLTREPTQKERIQQTPTHRRTDTTHRHIFIHTQTHTQARNTHTHTHTCRHRDTETQRHRKHADTQTRKHTHTDPSGPGYSFDKVQTTNPAAKLGFLFSRINRGQESTHLNLTWRKPASCGGIRIHLLD